MAGFARRLPQITDAARPATVAVEAEDESGRRQTVDIAGEHPLTLYLDRREVVTLMTLGHAPEALAIGYLRNQRLVDSIDAIAAVQVDWETDSVAVTTHTGSAGAAARLERRTVTTGCGQGTVFGDLMEEIDSVRLRDDVILAGDALVDLLERVRRHETIYKRSGAVHGCALAAAGNDAPRILMFVEDVGRHNAVDAIAGRMWIEDVDGSDKIFYTTGRLTSEMVIKCVQMRIPFLVSRSGLTSMGHALAARCGLTMIGRASGRHWLVFSGARRITALGDAPAAGRVS